MPTASPETFEARKARLLASFLLSLTERLTEARGQLAGLAPGSAQREALHALHLTFHTVKGTAASFGQGEIAELAREADEALKHALDDGASVSQPLLDTLGLVLARLADPAMSVPGAPGQEGRFRFEPARQPDADRQDGQTPTAPTPPPAAPAGQTDAPDGSALDQSVHDPRRKRRIYLCDDDIDLGEQLCAQLACFGYRATPFAGVEPLLAAARSEPPAAVIMDVVFPEGQDTGPIALLRLNADASEPIPSVFISCRDDFQSRLRAVKAGGSAYCTKPVKITELVELLDTLTQTAAPDPFHILVVDDEPQIARWHELILEDAGMIVRTATDPEQVPALLRGFNADLVLMDMYMPGCSGPELARVLRQIPGHVSLPIVYVSSETDLERQLAAMEVGADGFLAKPVAPARLVAEVTLRAERMRTLHALMVRDGLTGLFNHNAIMQFFHIGIANARREGRPLSFAMIDVDRFKQVNDRFGHPAGDQVLLALSRGLRLRLRDSDLVGRYGGEEFALVLPGTDAAEAHEILEGLRASFAQVVFYAGEERFACTFSAGVAELEPYQCADNLIEAADIALYRAKNAGRNRVEIAARSAPPGERSRDVGHG
jgi:diguanylate cyclase (GGDEF)-like protein